MNSLLKPLHDESGRLLDCVVTHFPNNSGVLLLRTDECDLKIQLVKVDDSGALVSARGEPLKLKERPVESNLRHTKAVWSGGGVSSAGLQSRLNAIEEAVHGLRMLIGDVREIHIPTAPKASPPVNA